MSHPTVTIGPIVVNFHTRAVTKISGDFLPMTTRSFDILGLLIAAKGAAVTKANFAAALHMPSALGFDHSSVRNAIHLLRRALPPDEHGRSLIQNHRLMGYWIREADPSPEH